MAGKGFGEISRKYGIEPEEIVKLGSNENPYGPSPKVAEALADISPERYPEPEELMAGLAGYTGYPEEMIMIGAGMDGVMDTLTRLFLEQGDRTFIPTPTFSYYEILTIWQGRAPLLASRPGISDLRRIAHGGKDGISLLAQQSHRQRHSEDECVPCWRARMPSSSWTRHTWSLRIRASWPGEEI